MAALFVYSLREGFPAQAPGGALEVKHNGSCLLSREHPGPWNPRLALGSVCHQGLWDAPAGSSESLTLGQVPAQPHFLCTAEGWPPGVAYCPAFQELVSCTNWSRSVWLLVAPSSNSLAYGDEYNSQGQVGAGFCHFPVRGGSGLGRCPPPANLGMSTC